MMRYVSTRGGANAMSFTETILGGLAPDGGLYMPASGWPVFTKDFLRSLRGKSYPYVVCAVLRHFAPEISPPTLFRMCRRAFTAEKFSHGRPDYNPKGIVHVSRLWENIFQSDLNCGPSQAFKDLAMQIVGEMIVYALMMTKREYINFLLATTGDTGPAAISAMKGRPGIKTFTIMPNRGMSAFQRYQMCGVIDPSVFNLVMNGDFDNAQAVVKAIMQDLDFKERYHIGAVNSINLGRIVAQVAYYVWTWLKMDLRDGEQFDVSIPSGNFGNAEAAFIAKQADLPIRHIIIATNENDVLHDFFTTGIYRPRTSRVITTSPSMDISVASNLERFIYDLVGQDSAKVREYYAGLKESGGVIDLSHLLPKIQDWGFKTARASITDVDNVIRQAYMQTGQIVDPHTAVAIFAATEHRTPAVPVVVMSTAQACKFNETIMRVLGRSAPMPPSMAGWESVRQDFIPVEYDVDQMKRIIEQNA